MLICVKYMSCHSLECFVICIHPPDSTLDVPLEYILNTPSHHRVHHGNSLHMIETVYSASKQNMVKILIKMRNERILSLAGVFWNLTLQYFKTCHRFHWIACENSWLSLLVAAGVWFVTAGIRSFNVSHFNLKPFSTFIYYSNFENVPKRQDYSKLTVTFWSFSKNSNISENGSEGHLNIFNQLRIDLEMKCFNYFRWQGLIVSVMVKLKQHDVIDRTPLELRVLV